ncbi:ligand-binding protein SH3 [Prauserella sp. PE36]|uniref:Ligand-binding protein SH3 n=1 Tax=Prauserella endophytica TaxID=1592324 RepID=A0ABY2S7Z9_9PSEU|nr:MULTISPECIES: SMR family transporter [Prauserella]PXY25932.1 ligand-binding protein SH3 [Prauserella coralliicola]RBM24171.1 ligand-binding protein SH3 [Prauserella sp. PE36]TKG71811.1 ligand-binding protein SH3 [Prauserella endophytica]
MAWIALIVSGLFETVWAAALSASRGLSKPVPSIVFGVALVISMAGLGYALRTLPVGTGYAVWVGVGAIGTAVYGMVAMGDPVSAGRITCLVLIVAGVAGLKILH